MSLFSELFYIFLSYCLVFGRLSFPAIGATGAAFAHLIQAFVSLLIALTIFYNSRYKITLKLNIKLIEIQKTTNLSYPMMLSMCFDYFSNFILFTMVGYFLNKESLAAGRIGFSIAMLCFSIIASLSYGFAIMGGRALGRKNNMLFLLYNKFNKNILIFVSLILFSLLIIAPQQISKLFTSFDEVQSMISTPIVIIAIATIFVGWSYSNASSLRLFEKVKADMICNMFSVWAVQIPAAYYLGVYCHFGLVGFFMALLCYDIAYALSTHYVLIRVIKK